MNWTTTEATIQTNVTRPPTYYNWEANLLFIINAILTVFGITANTITFLVIHKTKHLKKSPFNILVMSLCVTDIMSAVVSCFYIYGKTYGNPDYPLGAAVCKTVAGLKHLGEYGTIHHVFTFGLIRVAAIYLPLQMGKLTPKIAKILVVVLWVESFLITSLVYVLAANVTRNREKRLICTMVSREWRPFIEVYVKYTSVFVIHIPALGIVICGVIVATSFANMIRNPVKGQAPRKMKRERAALLQTIFIVISFLVGYSAPIVVRFLDTFVVTQEMFTDREYWQFLTSTYIVLRITECLNPVFYNYSSSQLWNATKEFLQGKDPNLLNSSTIRSGEGRRSGEEGRKLEEGKNLSNANSVV